MVLNLRKHLLHVEVVQTFLEGVSEIRGSPKSIVTLGPSVVGSPSWFVLTVCPRHKSEGFRRVRLGDRPTSMKYRSKWINRVVTETK